MVYNNNVAQECFFITIVYSVQIYVHEYVIEMKHFNRDPSTTNPLLPAIRLVDY